MSPQGRGARTKDVRTSRRHAAWTAATTLAVVVFTSSILLTSYPKAQQTPVFRGNVDLVVVYPLVFSDTGRLVTDLTAADFTVLDNGQPVPVTVFSKDTQPITAVVMLDMSASMDDSVVRVRDSASRLIEAIQPDDRLRVGTFGSEIVLSPHLTADKRTLTRVLREELWPGGSTPLWLALDAAMQSLATEGGRRTIVVVTDGIDTTSATQGRVIERAIKDLFMIYAIGIEGKGISKQLFSLVTETGGGFFGLNRGDDLGAAFAQVASDLRHQYLLGFTPATLDGRTHALDIHVDRPGYRVRAARQFVAPLKKSR